MGGVPVNAASRHEPIALALGAGGAIATGFSMGFAAGVCFWLLAISTTTMACDTHTLLGRIGRGSRPPLHRRPPD